MNEQPIISLSLVRAALELEVVVFTELLNLIEEEIEKAPDSDPMARFVEMMRDEGVEGWAQLYTDPTNQPKSIWLAILPPDKFNAMQLAIAAMSPAEQAQWLERLFVEGDQAISPLLEMDAEQIQSMWPEVSNDPVGVQWLGFRHAFIMAALFNSIAAMQTGKTMYQLVAEAMEDDEDSFVKAVQMDKTVLDFIPYFKDRVHRAAEDGQIAFLRRVHTHRNKPITSTLFEYAKLWLVFNTLDNMNLLDQFEQDIQGLAKLCQELRVYGPHPDVDVVDIEDFESRFKDYRRTQRQLLPRTKSNILVKDVSSSNSPP
jgi:hypothetical protein